MGLDDAFNKIKDAVEGKTIADSGIEQAAKAIDNATDGKFSSQINKAEEIAKDVLHKVQDHVKEEKKEDSPPNT